jgi:hypothetical protein
MLLEARNGKTASRGQRVLLEEMVSPAYYAHKTCFLSLFNKFYGCFENRPRNGISVLFLLIGEMYLLG